VSSGVNVFICSRGFESALEAELGGGEILCPGVVAKSEGRDVTPFDAVFARQILPDATLISGASIRALAEGALAAVWSHLDKVSGAWRIDAFAPDLVDDKLNEPAGALDRRAALVGERFLAILKERRRRLFRGRTDDARAMRVQRMQIDRERLIVSAATPIELATGGLWPAPFIGGRAPIADDWDAPSSAFRKLEEALAWMDARIEAGACVVDLGAAPGGWSHIALKCGASVVAVDRADLDPRIAANPRLVHERRTAFSFEPAKPPVDWLLCDVIAVPEKSVALLGRWVERGWCRRFVVHLKFKGQSDYARVGEAVRIARGAGFATVRGKHLLHDKNEVTIWGARADC
jgi:23S rRNA (cytidine2498-2'-O)-methyltransferase